MSEGHVVVVGGTKGLGKVIAENFLARGFITTVISRSKPEGESRFRHVSADLETITSEAAAVSVVSEIVTGQSPLRYVAFCQRYRGAGDTWAGELQVGATATRFLLDAFAPHFGSRGDRAVGVVSSVYAECVGSSQPVGYHVAKSALNTLVRYYAGALGKNGVRINAVMPLTYIKPENRAVYDKNKPLADLYAAFVPLGRMGHVEDSANAIDFFCSEKAGFVTGQCLFVDGGVSTLWGETIARSLSGL